MYETSDNMKKKKANKLTTKQKEVLRSNTYQKALPANEKTGQEHRSKMASTGGTHAAGGAQTAPHTHTGRKRRGGESETGNHQGEGMTESHGARPKSGESTNRGDNLSVPDTHP